MSGGLDLTKLMNLLRGPGMDTRVWLSFATVQKVSVVRTKKAGVFVDLILLPYEEEYTGWVGSPYAGSEAGFYFPLKAGDTILAALPYGDSAAGISVLARFNAGDRPPPEEFTANGAPSLDIVLVAEEEVNIRYITKGSGSIVFEPKGTGKFAVGGDPGSAGMEPMTLGDQATTALNAIKSWSAAEYAKIVLSLASLVPPPAVPYVPAAAPTLPNIKATKGEVK